VLTNVRPQGKDMLVARVEGVGDRAGAEKLTRIELYAPRAKLPEPEEDEFYLADLEGLRAETVEGATLGHVLAVRNFGAGDILEVRPPAGGETLMFPFTKAVVPIVDIAGGRVVIAPPVEIEARQLREHGLGRHRAVDDTPAGGGPGMVMRADVLCAAIDAAAAPDDGRPFLLMSPRGAPLSQARVREYARGPGALILCARFEGVDERVIAARGLEEVSVGDYILSGGEIAALALMDACVRLLPGVMGEEASGAEESFEGGLLEYPQYTRPRDFEGREIPPVLLSGDHAKIARWRRDESLRLTRARRPDLIAKLDLKD
jgi:tRNA (guanine37-N1)-methyltransferase